jgi:tetratricopeptide (TPR) repeat protein
MRVYVHDEEHEFTVALDWEESDRTNIEKLKLIFLEKQHNLDKNDQFELVSDRGKPVTLLKNKMDVFVKKIKQESSQKTSVNKTKKENDNQSIPPQNIVEIVAKLSEEAAQLFEKKKYNRAIEIYKELVKMGIDQAGCILNLGTMYYTVGNYQSAVDCFQKLFDMKKMDYQILIKLAESYFGLGDYTKALEYFNYALQFYEKMTAQFPNKDELESTITNEKRRIKVQFGKCLWELGQKEKAFSVIAVFEEIT